MNVKQTLGMRELEIASSEKLWSKIEGTIIIKSKGIRNNYYLVKICCSV